MQEKIQNISIIIKYYNNVLSDLSVFGAHFCNSE